MSKPIFDVVACVFFLGISASCFSPGSHPPATKDNFVSRNRALASTNGSDPYRSIADVVGGLHGGKYQFDQNGFDDSGFSGVGSRFGTNNPDDEEPEEVPNWAMQMKPLDTDEFRSGADVVSVESNAIQIDGMVHSTTIVIQNEERTWEQFYAKIMSRQADGTYIEMDKNYQFCVKPRFTYLAPRGGSSNACDASKPYSDSVALQIFHQGNRVDTSVDCWLVAGTEEKKCFYKIEINE